MNSSVKSASRVLEMLEFLSVTEKPIGVSDVARRLRLPKSSAQALLRTLLGRGYLVHAGLGYQLSPLVGSGGCRGLLSVHSRYDLLLAKSPLHA